MSRARLGALLAALAVAATAAAPAAAQEYAPEESHTAVWTRAQALKIQRDATNTKPRIAADFPVMSDEVWVWDTWPLTDLATRPLSYRAWNVIFSLVAPRTVGFPERHTIATIGYFYSRDGRSWRYGGEVFSRDTGLGERQWAGSAVLVGDEVNLFYTASGLGPDAVDPLVVQRLAHATATIRADENGVWFEGEGFRDSRIVAEADGRWYQTPDQSRGGPIIYAFRDPFVFRDPEDGEVYMLFEGNSAGRAGSHSCGAREVGPVPPGHTTPADARWYTGNIGLARATSASLRTWELLPPLLSANCVNQQTERPHLVIRDGDYHLFTISHEGTFAPGVTGPDGVYGWLGPSLRSNYQPLNASALVLGNPPEAPKQQYSEYVMPNWLVESFVETVPTGDGGERFGGTLAPTLRLAVEGANTYMVERLDFGYIPAMRAVR